MSGSGPIETIHVGVKYSFSMVTRDGSNFAVYERKRCDGSGIVDYAIARVPSDISFSEGPGSVLEAFPDRETAILALGRWVARPTLENRSRQARAECSARNISVPRWKWTSARCRPNSKSTARGDLATQ